MGCQKQEICCCPHGCSLRCRAVSHLLPNVPGPSSAPDQPNRSHMRSNTLPAILSFSRGFLLIHRAAWAVCPSGLRNPVPGGCRWVERLYGYSGPWPVFAAFPPLAKPICYLLITKSRICFIKITIRVIKNHAASFGVMAIWPAGTKKPLGEGQPYPNNYLCLFSYY